MCRSCGKPYEEDYELPHGPRAASAIPGLCVGCWAAALSEEEGEPIYWWECLLPEDGGYPETEEERFSYGP